jgi:hypothetical protein
LVAKDISHYKQKKKNKTNQYLKTEEVVKSRKQKNKMIAL